MTKTFIKTLVFLAILIGIIGCSSKEIVKQMEKEQEQEKEKIEQVEELSEEEVLEISTEIVKEILPIVFPPSAKIESIKPTRKIKLLRLI